MAASAVPMERIPTTVASAPASARAAAAA